VLEGMKLWRALDCTTTAPKPHAIEDHLIDQIRQFEGIGEFTEDFNEQVHRDGICDERKIRTYKDENDAATVLSNWEFQRKLPAIQMQVSQVNECSKRMKTCTDQNTGDIISIPLSQQEEKEKALKQGKRDARIMALHATANVEGPYLLTGHQRNVIEKRNQIEAIMNANASNNLP
jgi:hypothetical protein